MAGAIAAARAAGLLGPDVMGSGQAFDIEIRRGGGATPTQETALFNSIEGKRGEPRSKPPFPAEVGLFGKPTVANNVETLANVLDIVMDGGEAWSAVGTSGSTGTRLFCLSGDVVRPGLYEAPFGTTLRQIVDLAGGVPDGRAIRAVLLGGAAGTFVGPDRLDLPLTFEAAREAGATLGSGVVMVFDERADWPTRCGGLASSSITSRAASACRAASAPSGRWSCCHTCPSPQHRGDRVLAPSPSAAPRRQRHQRHGCARNSRRP